MNPLRLAIEGKRTDLKRLVCELAADRGFGLVACSEDEALGLSKATDVLVIWVASQVLPIKPETSGEYRSPISIDSRELHANAVLYCAESANVLRMQVNAFLVEIETGVIAVHDGGQTWRGYQMPLRVPYAMPPTLQESILAAS
ncbi:MAG: hypothetical protein ABIS59_02025 [Candidatus Saccharibacteria bacterium]